MCNLNIRKFGYDFRRFMIWTHDMYSLGVIVRSLLYSNHRVELFLLLLVGVSFTRWISVFDGTMIWKTLRLDFSDIQTFLVASQKDLFRSIVDGSSTIHKVEGTFSLFIRSIVPVWGILRSFFLFFFLQEIVSGRFSLSRNKLILFRRIRDNLVPRYRLRSDKLPRL